MGIEGLGITSKLEYIAILGADGFPFPHGIGMLKILSPLGTLKYDRSGPTINTCSFDYKYVSP